MSRSSIFVRTHNIKNPNFQLGDFKYPLVPCPAGYATGFLFTQLVRLQEVAEGC